MRTAVTALVGTAAILAAVGLAVTGVEAAPGDPVVVTVVATLFAVAFVGSLVKVAGARGDPDAVATAPWSATGALVDDAPERSPADHDLSGERLAGVVETAGETARADGTVDAGLDVVRPPLREALLDALVQGGADREAAKRSLADGTWTDDGVAAAVLDERVDHPGWALLERFEAWLFPERVVRREVKRAVQAVATTADEELPSVPGQRAPRSVPVLRPTLADLQRGADGQLQRAVDPLGALGGSPVDGTATVEDPTTVDESLRVGEATATVDAPSGTESSASGDDPSEPGDGSSGSPSLADTLPAPADGRSAADDEEVVE